VRGERSSRVVAHRFGVDLDARVQLAVLCDCEDGGRRGIGLDRNGLERLAGPARRRDLHAARGDLLRYVMLRRAQGHGQPGEDGPALVGLLQQGLSVHSDHVGSAVRDEWPTTCVEDLTAWGRHRVLAAVQQAGCLRRLVRIEYLHPIKPPEQREHE
jgi:hypothetical protein